MKDDVHFLLYPRRGYLLPRWLWWVCLVLALASGLSWGLEERLGIALNPRTLALRVGLGLMIPLLLIVADWRVRLIHRRFGEWRLRKRDHDEVA